MIRNAVLRWKGDFLTAFLLANAAYAQQLAYPYRCEDDARHLSQNKSLTIIRGDADALSTRADAIDLCAAAELYKRLGDARAQELYERAIAADPDEPAYELLYGDYLRLYRGAGQRPLFQEAEKHLFSARGKLIAAEKLGNSQRWNATTKARLQRSLTALYERDGIHLAKWTWRTEGSRDAVRRPWLFFSPGLRWEQTNADFDKTSDIRDRTSEAAFSSAEARLNRPLLRSELVGLARLMSPLEGSGRVRIRYRSAPIVDLSATGRRTGDAQVTDFFRPNGFNELKLLDFSVAIEKPFAINGNTDALACFAARRVNREGLIEFLPDATERITQYEASVALAHYLGPDRLNIAYTFVRQNINPEPQLLRHRERELMSGTVSYQIFRPLPLPNRNLETSLGRRFETRGIDLYAGVLDDNERFPVDPVDVFVARRDYFVGIAARGLGRFDVTVQPTWFTSRVSTDRSQDNSQLRAAGNLLFRVLDEERTGGIMPRERFLGLPVAFVQIVVPFHWDMPRGGIDMFRSRRLGGELWIKSFTRNDIGVSILSVVGYSRQWFPGLNRDLNLLRLGISVGF